MAVDSSLLNNLYNRLGVSSTEVEPTPVPEDPSMAAQAYEQYEELPIGAQILAGVAPGTGHAIAAYETPMFAGETKEALEEGNIPRALGQGALTGLSALGMIPGLGLGIRAVKAGAKAIRATAKEDQFWKEILSNSGERDELMEAIPSFSYKDGIVDVASKDINKFSHYLDDLDFASRGEDWSVPPRLRGKSTIAGHDKLYKDIWDRALSKEADPSYYTVKGNALDKLGLDTSDIDNMKKDARAYKKSLEKEYGEFDTRNPDIEQSIRDVNNEKSSWTIEDHIKLLDGVDEKEGLKPIRAYTSDKLPISPTNEQIAMSIPANQIIRGGIVDVNAPIKTGTKASSRLNVSAYEDYDTWVATLDIDNRPMTYASTVHLKGTSDNPVKFGWKKNIKELDTLEESAYKIGTAEIKSSGKTTTKYPFADISGNWVEHNTEELIDQAKKYIDRPNGEWVQVGFDPRRHSKFYTRQNFKNKAGEIIANKHSPVESASEVIQIGPLVLAKNPVFGTSMKYKKGGSVVERNPYTHNMKAI
jgi:hypothetical protein